MPKRSLAAQPSFPHPHKFRDTPEHVQWILTSNHLASHDHGDDDCYDSKKTEMFENFGGIVNQAPDQEVYTQAIVCDAKYFR